MKSIQKWGALLLAVCLLAGLMPVHVHAEHAPPHEYNGPWITEVEATCTADGRRYTVCTIPDCGFILYDTLKATGHKWPTQWDTVTPASCTTSGTIVRYCLNGCGQSEQKFTDPLGHAYPATWTVVVVGDCTTPAVSQRVCSRCGQVETSTTPAPGHNWGAWVSKKTATCTDVGIEERVCARCSQTQTRVLPALLHNWGPWTTVLAPTCQATGISRSVCSRCSLYQDRILPKVPHNWSAWTVTLAASCGTKGQEIRTCSMCNRVESRSLKALKHVSDGNWVITRAATLRQRGQQATTCTRCGQHASTRTYAPRGYRYEVWARAFGPMAGQASSALSGVTDRLIAIDMTQEGEHRFPLVTDDGWQIGTVVAKVAGGTLSVSLQQLSEPTVMREQQWQLFSGLHEVSVFSLRAASMPFDMPVKVSGPVAIFSVSTLSNYYQGNENKTFHEAGLSPDGQSYTELNERMTVLMRGQGSGRLVVGP